MFKEKFKFFIEKEKTISEKKNCNKNELNSKQNSFFYNGNRTPFVPTKTKQNFILESTAKLSTSMNLTKLIKSIPHIHKPQTSYNFERPKNLNPMTENINKYNNKKITNNNKIFSFANTEKIRISQKKFGIIHSYSAITSEGHRNYNEDRICIIYNIYQNSILQNSTPQNDIPQNSTPQNDIPQNDIPQNDIPQNSI
jgi:hypothetical protein